MSHASVAASGPQQSTEEVFPFSLLDLAAVWTMDHDPSSPSVEDWEALEDWKERAQLLKCVPSVDSATLRRLTAKSRRRIDDE